MTPFVTAGAGFLLAVLWFDLMHDVQAAGPREGELPADALASIAGYYRRVTTDARPMNRLVAATMVGTLVAVVAQIAGDHRPAWAAWASLALVVGAVALAGTSTVPRAVRLGQRRGSPREQTVMARTVLRDHLWCLAAISTVLVLQLGFLR